MGILDSFYQTVIYDNRYKFILEGLFHTIIIALFAVIIGVVIGTIVALIRNNYEKNNKMKIGNLICKLYVNIIRGTPVVLQLMIIYYVIFKSADNYKQIMQFIILPQAIKNVLPALGNEFITLLKETSVGAYIGVLELTKASDIIASRTYDYFFPLLIIASLYLVMTLGLTKLVNKMERKLNNVRS